MAFSKEKPHFYTALLLFLTGLEGLLWLGLFLPQVKEVSRGGGVVGLLAGWALAAFAFALLGGAALLGQKLAKTILERINFFLSPSRPYARWVVPGILAGYLAISTLVVIAWGANNAFLNQAAEPLGRWFFLAALQALLVALFVREQPASWNFKKAAAVSLAIIAVVWIGVVSTRIGLEPDNRYWNVAGVPVLINQLAMVFGLALLAVFLYGLLTKKVSANTRRREILLDLLACLILWAGAAWFWHQAPFSNSFFAEGVFPPNQDFYPYSDAALTDLGGQYMLIGKGLEYPFFTEKPLYALFLGLLHKFVGQRYLTVSGWQLICFAVLPVLLYLLGKQLHNRLFGVSIALFSIAKEYNAIFSTFKISVSNSRLYLSEFPTLILMVLLAIALVSWFKSAGKEGPLPLLAGGALGLAAMVRTNPLLLAPIILLFALWFYRRSLKRFWTSALLFIGGFALVLGPWLAFTWIKYGTDPFTYKISAVIQTRFLQQEQRPAPTGLEQHPVSLLGEKPVIPADIKPSEAAPLSQRLGVFGFTLGHFFNNQIKALFTLPFAVYPLELTPVLDLPYWREPVSWTGELPLSSGFAFALNLTLISLGITAGWKRNGAAGLVPLLLNIGYYLSNALGRTSGSRYLLPVDWTIYFYYLFGLVLLYETGAHLRSVLPEEQLAAAALVRTEDKRKPRVLGVAVLLLLVGSAVPLINISFPDLYTDQQKDTNITALYASPIFTSHPELVDESDALLRKTSARIFRGRMLYPRYRDFALSGKEGLILTVLQPELTEVFFSFDTDDLTYLEPGKDILVLGCQREGFVEGFVAFLPEQGVTLRTNDQEFVGSCP